MPETSTPSPRLHGIDLARALAIIGMVYAHVGPSNTDTVWLDLADKLTTGFASATFATLAGVSLSIMSRNPSAATTHRLLVRGIILMVIGTGLQLIQSTIAVVLIAIGIIFVLLPPVARWHIGWVLFLLVNLITIGPMVQVISTYLATTPEVLDPPYPAFAWLTYGTLGILIHRYMVPSIAQQIAALVCGTAVGVGLVLVRDAISMVIDQSESIHSDIPLPVAIYINPEPHFGGYLDVVASCAVASAVIACCLLIVRWCCRPLYPLRALGSISLTFYVCHVLTAGPIMDYASDAFIETPTAITGTATATSANDATSEVTQSNDPMALHWEEYQHLVQNYSSFEEFQDPETEFYSRIYGEASTADINDFNDVPNYLPIFWTTLIIGFIFAPIWRWFFRRGPLEWVMHQLIERAVRTPVAAKQPGQGEIEGNSQLLPPPRQP